jgi:hypothetical protein
MLEPVKITDKAMASAAGMSRVRYQLRRLGRGKATRPKVNPKIVFVGDQLREQIALRRYRTWLSRRNAEHLSHGS